MAEEAMEDEDDDGGWMDPACKSWVYQAWQLITE